MTMLIENTEEGLLRSKVQQFFDEWHFRLLHSHVAITWDRETGILKALELFEECGLELSPEEKDELCLMDEDGMIDAILRYMPDSLRRNIGHFLLNVKLALSTSTRVRAAIEEGDFKEVAKIMQDGDSGIGQQIMKQCVLEASREIAEMREVKGSWAKSMDSRLARLSHCASEAEAAATELEKVEGELDLFKSSQSEKSKKVLLNLASEQDKVFLGTVLCGWVTLFQKSKDERDMRQKFEAEIDNAKAKLAEYKASNLDNVRGMMLKRAAAGDKALMADVFAGWMKTAVALKLEAKQTAQLKEAEERLVSMKAASKANARASMERFTASSVQALMTSTWEAWVKHWSEEKKEREFTETSTKMANQLETMQQAKREEAKAVFARMIGSSEAGLQATCFTGWAELSKEERTSRELEKSTREHETKYAMLNSKQKGLAGNAAERANQLEDYNLMMRIFVNWAMEWEVEKVQQRYDARLDGKRQKLEAVHALFLNFADKLEDTVPKKHSRSSSPQKTAALEPPPAAGTYGGTYGAPALEPPTLLPEPAAIPPLAYPLAPAAASSRPERAAPAAPQAAASSSSDSARKAPLPDKVARQLLADPAVQQAIKAQGQDPAKALQSLPVQQQIMKTCKEKFPEYASSLAQGLGGSGSRSSSASAT